MSDPKYSGAKLTDGVPCPVSHCLAYAIVTDKLYAGEGGAHLISLFFASYEPAYSGLIFETPQALPKADTPNAIAPTYYRPTDVASRFSGKLYTFVALDSNADIYAPSRALFDDLLKSMVIDSK